MTETPRVAVVTGAARGIGASIARRLSADGHAVALLDLTEEASQETLTTIQDAGGRALAVAVDVSDETAVDTAIGRVVAELGAPTILINNAGITRDQLIFRMSLDQWDQVVGVHLRGAFLMTRAVQKSMVAEKFGRIVSLSSISALGSRGQVNYSAAKAGIEGFTRTVAIELGQFGITANAIAPGLIETDMLRGGAKSMGLTWEEYSTDAAAKIPVRRIGQPEDIAATVSFLVREETSFLSGQVLTVAGGPPSLGH